MEHPEFTIVTGQVYDNLRKDIQKKLTDNWKLHGTIFTYIAPNGGTISAQAMVKGNVYPKICIKGDKNEHTTS